MSRKLSWDKYLFCAAIVIVVAGLVMIYSASAILAMQKTGGDTNADKLIAAMEGLTFDTPKGQMSFRKEDHQALQDMYYWRIKKDGKDNDMLEIPGLTVENWAS